MKRAAKEMERQQRLEKKKEKRDEELRKKEEKQKKKAMKSSMKLAFNSTHTHMQSCIHAHPHAHTHPHTHAHTTNHSALLLRRKGQKDKAAPQKKSYFGSELTDITTEDNQLPVFVVRCVEVIDKDGLDVEGIYRLSGKQDEVVELHCKFDNGVCVCVCVCVRTRV